MRKQLYISLLLFLLGMGVKAQKKDLIKRYGRIVSDSGIVYKYVSKLISDESDISKPQFLVYPTVAYSPETSWEFGLSSLYVYYADRDTLNRLSQINGFVFYTLENQYGFQFENALYTHKDTWFLLGRSKFQSFPMLYHGIGPDAPAEYQAVVEANQLQIKQRMFRNIVPNLYGGLELDYQRLGGVNFTRSSLQETDYPPGSKGSANFGLGLGVMYDDRRNVLNVRKGFSSELAFLRYDHLIGSDFSFTSLFTDTRIYRPINHNDVLAAHFLGQFNFGETPFNQLALLGGESIMRGYYLGRFRDNNLMATQLEYRFLPLPLGFSKRFGAAVFGGTGAVFNELRAFTHKNLVWAGGAGLRFLVFPHKDVYTRLDVAFTNEGPGFYIFIGEAF